MAKLDFLLDGNHLGAFTLEKERMTIGRRPSCDIHIDNLAVSGEHAVIVTIGDDSFLEDLNSTNGTMVNHKTIKKHVLQHNDVVEFGKYQLKYLNEKHAKLPPADDFEKTMIIRPTSTDMLAVNDIKAAELSAVVDKNATNIPGVLKPQMTTLFSTPSSVSTPNMTASINDIAVSADNTDVSISNLVTPDAMKAPVTGRIQVLNGNSAGREVLLNKAMVTLGKPGAQVAVITKRPHGFFITHVEGELQPVVNGKTIGMQAFALNDHDVIELAGTKMEFYFA